MSPPGAQRNIKSPLHSSFKHHRSTYSTARLRDEEFAALSVRPRASSDAGINDSRSRSQTRRRSLRFASLVGDEEDDEEEEDDSQSKYDWASLCDMLYSKLRTTDFGRLTMRSRRRSECSIPTTEKLNQRRLSSPSARSYERDYSGGRNEDNPNNRAYNTFRLKEKEFAITPTRSHSERRRPLLGKSEVQQSSIKESDSTPDQTVHETTTKPNRIQRHRSSSHSSDVTTIKEGDRSSAVTPSVGALRDGVNRPRSGSDPRITPITINRPDFSRRSLKQKPTYIIESTVTPNFLNPNTDVSSLRSRSYTNLQERSSEFQTNGQSRRPRSVSPIDMGLLGGSYIDPSIIEKFLMDTTPETKNSESATVEPPNYVESQNDSTATHEDPPPTYDEACLSFKI